MPYIITTVTPRFMQSTAGLSRMNPTTIRTAVATLEEAQHKAYDLAAEANRYGGAEDDAYTLPEDGGTIGPLADRTVIEVKRVDWLELAASVRQSLIGAAPDQILAAFNAHQEA